MASRCTDVPGCSGWFRGGVVSYDSAKSGVPISAQFPDKNFFPIDDGLPTSTKGDGFGNQGNLHNYHFTVELQVVAAGGKLK